MPERIPDVMAAVLLTGHGGFEKLQYRTDVPVPRPDADEVLIKIGAAGINNTDINTRIGWYSKTISESTDAAARPEARQPSAEDASWSGTSLQFPRIQGADACGRIVAVGAGVDPGRIGRRVLVRTIMRYYCGGRPFDSWTFGADIDGGFAQYAKVASLEAYAVDSDLTDIELASFPCAYSTAENLLHRASVGLGERVLITGASGGVGSAAVQLAKRRGAEVIAVAAQPKAAEILKLGADHVVHRGLSLVDEIGRDSVHAVIDLVAGPGWPELPDVLRRGGRYATSGAIAGPIVPFDIRTLYLKDLTFFGCTFQDDVVFDNLIGYIERSEVRPLIANSYPLSEIVEAQKEFLAKGFVGKIGLVPPQDSIC